VGFLSGATTPYFSELGGVILGLLLFGGLSSRSVEVKIASNFLTNNLKMARRNWGNLRGGLLSNGYNLKKRP